MLNQDFAGLVEVLNADFFVTANDGKAVVKDGTGFDGVFNSSNELRRRQGAAMSGSADGGVGGWVRMRHGKWQGVGLMVRPL